MGMPMAARERIRKGPPLHGEKGGQPQEEHAEKALHAAHIGEGETGGIGHFHEGGQHPVAGAGRKYNKCIESLVHDFLQKKSTALL